MDISEAKFHVSFFVNIEQLPQVLNSVLPIGVFEFKTEFVILNKSINNGQNPMLALPPPTGYKQRKARATNARKSPQGEAAKVIRRVFSHLPDHQGKASDCYKAFEKAGLCAIQSGAFQSLIDAGEMKRVARGTYALVKG